MKISARSAPPRDKSLRPLRLCVNPKKAISPQATLLRAPAPPREILSGRCLHQTTPLVSCFIGFVILIEGPLLGCFECGAVTGFTQWRRGRKGGGTRVSRRRGDAEGSGAELALLGCGGVLRGRVFKIRVNAREIFCGEGLGISREDAKARRMEISLPPFVLSRP